MVSWNPVQQLSTASFLDFFILRHRLLLLLLLLLLLRLRLLLLLLLILVLLVLALIDLGGEPILTEWLSCQYRNWCV
jgi:hypothetical protein